MSTEFLKGKPTRQGGKRFTNGTDRRIISVRTGQDPEANCMLAVASCRNGSSATFMASTSVQLAKLYRANQDIDKEPTAWYRRWITNFAYAPMQGPVK